MMRKLIMAGIAMMTIAISSCDDETMTLGDSLTSDVDKFKTVTATIDVATNSLMTDSVLAASIYHYLGKIEDPETDSYISSDYMVQFNVLEKESTKIFPDKDAVGKDDSGLPVADSCVVRIMINSFQGDSLAAMKLQLCELEKPVPNNVKYYTDFDVEESGYLRANKDASGNPINIVNQSKTYSVSDLTMSDSLRNVLRGSSYYQYITIPLKKAYTDKNGTTYPGYDSSKGYGTGYGTYLLRQYYEHPEYFKNSNAFLRNICPGFYVKSVDGEGVLLEVANTQLIIYYHYDNNGTKTDNIYSFTSTQEVLQTTHITNDKNRIKSLVEDSTQCTYLKTPSGIFTEVSLPIDKIKWLEITDNEGNKSSHLNDTIVSAKITFQAIRNNSPLSNTILKEPTNLLLLPRNDLYTFFESNSIPNNITSYIASYNSTQKTYTFDAIGDLINYIYNKMKPEITNADGTVNLSKVEDYQKANPNWNKVVLVPVLVSSTSSNGSTTVSSVSNSMSISSVRLIGGSKNTHAPVAITVMYSKTE